MSTAQCSSCGKQYKLTEQVAGKRVRCKACGNVFQVPSLEPAADPLGDFGTGDDPLGGLGSNDNFADMDFSTDLPAAPSLPKMRPARTASPSAEQNVSSSGSVGGLQYEICGSGMQYCVITLAPGQTVAAEAGAMMFMSNGIKMDTVMGDPKQSQGFLSKVAAGAKRAVTGESLFITIFENISSSPEQVGFASPYPGKILPLHLDELNGEVICQKGAFLCGTAGTQVSIAFQKKIGVGLFGGEGFIMQRIAGNGVAMVHGGGTMMHRMLGHGERLRVDTGCLMALGQQVTYDVEFVGGIKNTFFGGEGVFLATVTGPGPIWLQSLPFSRLAGQVVENSGGGGGKGEGTILNQIGNIGEMLLGD
jgi:uncharacterized protein (TIGR00266 family)